VRGFTPFHAGLCLIALAAAMLIAAPRSAALAQRFGARVVVATGLALIALAYSVYFVVDASTPLWVIEVLLFVQGLGMGNVMAPATNVIMSSIPRQKAGAGSAVNNTIRQVGGALGVAILGSILSAAYRGHLGSAADALPAPARGSDAAESIGGTLSAIGRTVDGVAHGQFPRQVLSAVPGVRQAADDAFVSAMHATSLGAALAVLVGSLVVLVFLPGRQRMIAHHAAEQERVEAAVGS
jgi:MFS transporter, DHA2 family, multidrug resistance protein